MCSNVWVNVCFFLGNVLITSHNNLKLINNRPLVCKKDVVLLEALLF